MTKWKWKWKFIIGFGKCSAIWPFHMYRSGQIYNPYPLPSSCFSLPSPNLNPFSPHCATCGKSIDARFSNVLMSFPTVYDFTDARLTSRKAPKTRKTSRNTFNTNIKYKSHLTNDIFVTFLFQQQCTIKRCQIIDVNFPQFPQKLFEYKEPQIFCGNFH